MPVILSPVTRRDGYCDDAAAMVTVTAAREFDSNLLTGRHGKLMQALGLPTNIRARKGGIVRT